MSSFSILKLRRKKTQRKTQTKNSISHENILTAASLAPYPGASMENLHQLASMENLHPLPTLMNLHPTTPLVNPQAVGMMLNPQAVGMMLNPLPSLVNPQPVAPVSNLPPNTSITFPTISNYKEIVTIEDEDEDEVNLKKKKECENIHVAEQAEQMMKELSSLQHEEFNLTAFDFNDSVDAFNQFSHISTSGNSSNTETNITPTTPFKTSSTTLPFNIPAEHAFNISGSQALNIPSSRPFISSSPSASTSSLSMMQATSSISFNALHNSSEDAYLTFSDKEELKKLLQINENKNHRQSYLCTTPKYIRLIKCESKLKIRIKQSHEELKKLLRKLNSINKMKMIEINTLTK